MDTRKSIALVGCGRWGAHILRDLLALNCNVHVVAVSEDSRTRAQNGAATSIVDSIANLPAVAGAVVASTTSSHHEVIENLIPLNIPVYVEKPMTVDADAAVSICQRAGERIFVMDKWRYHPGVRLLAEIARSEELGPVQGIRSTRVQNSMPHSDVDTIWILAPHDLSIALEILGFLPEAKYALADLSASGPVGMIAVLGDAPWLNFEVSARYADTRREVRLHCRDGVAVLNDAYSEHLSIFRFSDAVLNTVPELRPIPKEMPLFLELKAFVEHLSGGPPPKSSAQEAALIISRIEKLRSLAGLDAKIA